MQALGMSRNTISSSNSFLFLELFDFQLTNLCLDEHMLPHNYSLLKISIALQTSRKREFSGRGWATRHELPDPFNSFKWLAISFHVCSSPLLLL